MKKLWILFTCILVSTSSYIMSMEEQKKITPSKAEFTQSQMDLTSELYKITLTPKKLKNLHTKGALINGRTPKYKSKDFISGYSDCHEYEPLSHWVINFHTNYKIPRNVHYDDSDLCYKDLNNITQLLELGAEPTGSFELYYPDLIRYSLNFAKFGAATNKFRDRNLEILLKSKPKQINADQLRDIWEDTITKENHPYVDLLVQYFTVEELQAGLDYCITNRDNILAGFDYSHEKCKQYLLDIIQKLINSGARPNELLLKSLAHNIHMFYSRDNQEHSVNIEKIIVLGNNGAFEEATLNILECHLTEMQNYQALCIKAIELMKKNKLNNATSTEKNKLT